MPKIFTTQTGNEQVFVVHGKPANLRDGECAWFEERVGVRKQVEWDTERGGWIPYFPKPYHHEF